MFLGAQFSFLLIRFSFREFISFFRKIRSHMESPTSDVFPILFRHFFFFFFFFIFDLSRTENHKVTSSFNGFLFSLDYSFRLFHSLFWRFHSEKKEPPSSTLLTDQSRRCGYVICVCVCVSVCSVNVCVCE
jgi:hypothetical protein